MTRLRYLRNYLLSSVNRGLFYVEAMREPPPGTLRFLGTPSTASATEEHDRMAIVDVPRGHGMSSLSAVYSPSGARS